MVDCILINNCLNVAGEYGGRVFGGYVKDVIIPRLDNPRCVTNFRNVDLWFETQASADEFISKMGSNLKFHKLYNPGKTNNKIVRSRYHLFGNNICVLLDIIISHNIPVNDFHINRLTCKYNHGRKEFKYFGKSVSQEHVIDAINNKEAIMFPHYINILNNQNHNLNRIATSFLDKGWKILCPVSQLPAFIKELGKLTKHPITTHIATHDSVNYLVIQSNIENNHIKLDDLSNDQVLILENQSNDQVLILENQSNDQFDGTLLNSQPSLTIKDSGSLNVQTDSSEESANSNGVSQKLPTKDDIINNLQPKEVILSKDDLLNKNQPKEVILSKDDLIRSFNRYWTRPKYQFALLYNLNIDYFIKWLNYEIDGYLSQVCTQAVNNYLSQMAENESYLNTRMVVTGSQLQRVIQTGYKLSSEDCNENLNSDELYFIIECH